MGVKHPAQAASLRPGFEDRRVSRQIRLRSEIRSEDVSAVISSNGSEGTNGDRDELERGRERGRGGTRERGAGGGAGGGCVMLTEQGEKEKAEGRVRVSWGSG